MPQLCGGTTGEQIFHLGLVSKMHISVYMLFTEWKCFCFFFIEYNLGIMNIQCIL